MAITTTEANFKKHLNNYLDQVSEDKQTILITRTKQKAVAIFSKGELDTLLDATHAKENSLDFAIARDKLIGMNVLPDVPIVKSTDDYWDNFK